MVGGRSTSQHRWARHPDALWHEVSSGCVVSVHDEYLFLNGPVTALWLSLDEPVAQDELIAGLSSMYQLDRSTIIDEIQPAIDALHTKGAIQQVT